MLRGLDIRDMLIIDRLELEFQPGLNVLTGETGAGKSILLDSLGFVLGWRGRADLVRQGAGQGEVTAWFDLPDDHPARAVLSEAGIPGGSELILRRVNTADGRKTAWVNDRRTSGDVLRALSDTLVELHGQHDDRGLLNPRGHLALLDAFMARADLIETTRAAWSARRAATRELETARAALDEVRAEEDFLRHAVAELDTLDPQPGEDDALDTRRRLMQSAGKVREDIARAAAALGSDGAEGLLTDALRWLDGAADGTEGRLDVPLSALSRALTELGEATDGVERCLEELSVDPLELERTEERLFAIRAAARKHGVAPDDLPAFADSLRERLNRLDSGAEHMKSLERTASEAEARHAAAAQELSDARAQAAARLDAAVMQELAPLKMERAVFRTVIDRREPGPDGIDDATFTVATNPGAPAGALNRIASGGELSRFLLALKVCLRGEQSEATMIFDEIDRGVGGATADAVGRRLASLARSGQVLVVTHSPQVAALGAHHWRVAKRVEGDVTLSTVTPLNPSARVDEIARMLSGDRVTDEARAAALALLG
ncbi:DNA repair protein RecN [Pseudooceanicola batsensis HTCC2597]|uniref:DNA repair protein RecN n=1 Tax=Pseudooceanicola batsensis (strain ATCC BAA-863 / DSM 15984 / KCTC 12145 / HTCC2597) TaxID=252305 RepID=A3TZC7_PSEBH|nr:DNA repair protein RecN [Pseudooceanicola batsensis]EAQ02945.1 DNA repair protein RecN [Pseudooceanicola batsensis HTCC2597]